MFEFYRPAPTLSGAQKPALWINAKLCTTLGLNGQRKPLKPK